jgi:pyruvate formate lyase activating enzyme
MDTCKNRAILKDDIGVNVDKTLCTNCGVCTNKCNTGALTLIGEWVTAERVLEELESDKVFYEKSKGGVTVSGGEPLFQPKFTEDLLRLSKERRIHTALDTSGFGSWRHMKKILKYVDLVLFDIKHMDPIVHRKYTGVVNESILKNALRTSQDGKDMAIRVPVIPTINDQRENIDRIAEFVGRLRNVQEVDLLPYHKLGISKYGMLGRKYLLRHLQMNERVLLDIRKQLEHYGFQVRIVR